MAWRWVWIIAGVLVAVPALVYQDTFIIAVGPVVLLSLLVGWRSGKFNWFVLAASALFVEYIWLLAERVARGAELVAVGAGVLLLLFLELAYFGCLRSKVGKAQDHRRKYSGCRFSRGSAADLFSYPAAGWSGGPCQPGCSGAYSPDAAD